MAHLQLCLSQVPAGHLFCLGHLPSGDSGHSMVCVSLQLLPWAGEGLIDNAADGMFFHLSLFLFFSGRTFIILVYATQFGGAFF